ncbi:MAG TPA: PadR family transcriptional regulator [Candidatus Paceibacterota bacterium]|nr:PadR family transcriptional regulator [Candidatus Paceibacterota bacterium]
MKEESIENAKAQMRKGFLEFCILLIISNGKMYASDILQKLTKANLIVVEGTLYPLLNRLKNQGLLEYEWEESPTGPPRKYYSLTQNGTHALNRLEEVWDDLRKSIITLKK